jgi:hypothetical protein
MPTPKGWTSADVAKRDKCAQDLIDQGKDKSNAYAICTAMVDKTRAKRARGSSAAQ